MSFRKSDNQTISSLRYSSLRKKSRKNDEKSEEKNDNGFVRLFRQVSHSSLKCAGGKADVKKHGLVWLSQQANF